MQVVVNGMLTHYVRSGRGPCLVFLHGWGSEAATFGRLIDALSATHECVALDLPGFGKTEPPAIAWGLPEYARFVRDFLAKIGILEVAAFVGHSNGGAIAIYGLAQGTFKTDKLVLLASAGVRAKHGARKLAYKAAAKTGKLLTRPLPGAIRQKLRRKLYGSIGSDMLTVPHLQATFQKTVGQDLQAEAARVAVPVLLIYGDADTDTPLADGQKLAARIPASTLKILPGAGHFVHTEEPQTVLRHIQEFMR